MENTERTTLYLPQACAMWLGYQAAKDRRRKNDLILDALRAAHAKATEADPNTPPWEDPA